MILSFRFCVEAESNVVVWKARIGTSSLVPKYLLVSVRKRRKKMPFSPYSLNSLQRDQSYVIDLSNEVGVI